MTDETTAVWTHISGDYDDLIRRDLDRRKEDQELSDKTTIEMRAASIVADTVGNYMSAIQRRDDPD